MKKTCALILAVLLLATAAACGGSKPAPTSPPASPGTSTPSPDGGEGLTITDMKGRTRTLEKPVERIVVLTAADCEILFALGAGDKVVARGEYCDYPAEALELPAVSSGSETNIEQIIALNPDVVIMSTMDQTLDQIESIENAGIPVLTTNAQTIDGVYEAIAMIGQVVGRNQEAENLIQYMKDAFAELVAKVPQAEKKPTIYVEVSPLRYGLWAAGKGTFVNELAEMLGAENIFADIDQWGEVSEEQVIQRDPDFIVTTTMSFEGDTDPIEEILSRPGWSGIKAIANGKVFNADGYEIIRPGPRLVDAARQLYDFLYGDAA